jgi:hypothetical protein
MDLDGLLRDRFTFLYIGVRTSQDTRLWWSADCYGDSFTLFLPTLSHTLLLDLILAL